MAVLEMKFNPHRTNPLPPAHHPLVASSEFVRWVERSTCRDHLRSLSLFPKASEYFAIVQNARVSSPSRLSSIAPCDRVSLVAEEKVESRKSKNN